MFSKWWSVSLITILAVSCISHIRTNEFHNGQKINNVSQGSNAISTQISENLKKMSIKTFEFITNMEQKFKLNENPQSNYSKLLIQIEQSIEMQLNAEENKPKTVRLPTMIICAIIVFILGSILVILAFILYFRDDNVTDGRCNTVHNQLIGPNDSSDLVELSAHSLSYNRRSQIHKKNYSTRNKWKTFLKK